MPKIMPAFHTLTGADYTAPLFGRSKYSILQNMQKYSNTKRLLLSLNTERIEVSSLNCLKSEKRTAQSSYATAIKTSKNEKEIV